MAKKRKIRKTRLRKNPNRKQSKICDKAKRLVKRKKTRMQAKALFAEAERQGKPCRRRKRASRVKVTKARRNPYIPYLIYGDARPHRAKTGRVARYYWTGYKFTTDKKYAEHFPNAESAFNTCKRIRNRLPNALEFVAVQRVA